MQHSAVECRHFMYNQSVCMHLHLLVECGHLEVTFGMITRSKLSLYLEICWFNGMQSKSRGVTSPGPESLEAAR